MCPETWPDLCDREPGPLKRNVAPLATEDGINKQGAFLAFKKENEIISSLDF